MQRIIVVSAALSAVIIVFVTTASADDSPPTTDELPLVAYVDPVETLTESFGGSLEEPLVDAPLGGVATVIADLSGMSCRIANDQLAKEGFSSETRVSLAAGVPLYMALDRMCLEELSPATENCRLAWLIDLDAGEIVVTTDYQVADQIVPFNYAVGDLSVDAYPEGLVPGVEFRDFWLTDAIQLHCGGEWIDLDGLGGEIERTEGYLQVQQAFGVQRKIDALLSALRKRAMVIYVDQPPQTAGLDNALERIIESPIESRSFEDGLQQIAEESELSIEFEPRFIRNHPAVRRALTETRTGDQPLRTVLDELLANIEFPEAQLGYFIAHDTIWIGHDRPRFILNAHNETVLYDVADLVRRINSETLLSRIYEGTNSQWIAMNGVGGPISFTPYGYMIVTHTRQIQYRVRDQIEEMRSNAAACEDNTPRDANGN